MAGQGESREQDIEAVGHSDSASMIRKKDNVGAQLAVSFLIQSRAPVNGWCCAYLGQSLAASSI